MSKAKEKLIIIDGNALVHRSFHALPQSMMTSSGEITNAVYGFAAALLKALRELRPEYVVLTIDAKGPNFRHKMFKGYKAKRVKAPQELYDQIPRVKELAEAFSIPVFEKQGFEADDLIGTIVKQVNGDVEKIILTGDQDTLQLVNDHVRVYAISRGVADSTIYDAEAVERKLGVTPSQIIDYKALRGDPSDNIPGVRGIGEKTAVVLLEKFKSLDKIYEAVDKTPEKLEEVVKPRIVELLKEHRDEAYLSQELAIIKCDVPIKFDLEKTRFRTYEHRKAVEFFQQMEFHSLLSRLQTLGNSDLVNTKEEIAEKSEDKFERNRRKFNYTLINDENKFKGFLDKLKKTKEFTFDTETSDFDPITAELLGISFSWNEGEAWYVKVRQEDGGAKPADDEPNLFSYQTNNSKKKTDKHTHPWIKQLEPIFANEKIKKSAHNAKFDIRVMTNNGITTKGLDFDSMIASYLLNPGTRQHNLDAVTFSLLNFEKISKDDLLGRGRDKIGFAELDDERLMLYSAEDADFTHRLKKVLAAKLKDANLDKLFREIELPLVEVLAAIEDNGVKLDVDFLAEMSKEMKKHIARIEKKIYDLAGEEFNVSSTQQLQVVLFEKLEIPTDRVSKTKTGISTASSELEKLMDMHPIIKLIQEYRELTKLTSTYVDSLPRLINKKTGRVHTSFNQTVAATGRLSSTDPNLQNIPVRTDMGKKIRQAFVADRGNRLLALDYSQIELRLAAHMSADPKMIAAFKHNADIHRSTAAEINQVDPAVVDTKMRREAKAINFGILYGQGPRGLSQTADIPYERAREFIEQYFTVYKNIKKFIDDTLEFAREHGYVTTLFGRIRPLPEITSTVTMIRKSAERMAVNTPLQGTAADMIKKAMIEVDEMIKQEYAGDDIRMISQVHDELLFEAKASLVAEAGAKIKQIMENVIKLKVPVIVDVSTGMNWGEMKKIVLD